MKSMLNRIGLVVVLAMASFATHAATVGSRFDPNDYTPLGDLTTGPIVFSTTTLAVTTNGVSIGTGVLVTNESENVVMAMFNFDSINIGSGVSVTIGGVRGLVLGSRGDITIGTTIDLAGDDGTGGAGGNGGPGACDGTAGSTTNCTAQSGTRGDGGADGNGGTQQKPGFGFGGGTVNTGASATKGGGGGYGGRGGYIEGTTAQSGKAYGDAPLADLLGGSGGAGSSAAVNIDDAAGGGGGGAIELTAGGTITLQSTGVIDVHGGTTTQQTDAGERGAGGGSGGGILLTAPTVTLASGSELNANGGNGGTGDAGETRGGGAGGGGRIAIYADILTTTGATIGYSGGITANSGGDGTGDDGTYYTAFFSPDIAIVTASPLVISDTPVGLTNDTQYVTVTNLITAGQALNITNFTFTGDTNEFYIAAISDTGQVAVGISTNIYVSFEPTNSTDNPREVVLTIWSGDPDTPSTNITIQGNGIPASPDIDSDPPSLSFGSVVTGQVSVLTVTITNVGNAVLTISSVETNGAAPGQFTVTSAALTTIPVNGSGAIDVQYHPDSVGTHSANLKITSDDPDETVFNVPLNGVGLSYQDIDVSPLSYDYGQTLVNKTNSMTLAIENTGDANLTVSSIDVGGGIECVVLESFPLVVVGNSTSNVVVEFRPTSHASQSGTLTVNSDDPDAGEQAIVVNLSGYGVNSLDLDATSGTLDINTTAGTIIHNPTVGDPVTYTAPASVNGTVTWTFGDLSIADSGNVTLTMIGENGIILEADGQGVLQTGNILINQPLVLNGESKSGNNQLGGIRALGGGAGGDDPDNASYVDKEGEGGQDWVRRLNGGGGSGEGDGNTTGQDGGAGGGLGGLGGWSYADQHQGGDQIGRADLADLGTSTVRGGSGGGGGKQGAGGAGGGAIQLKAVNNITVVNISADGGNGGSGGTSPLDQKGGGGGSGGAIRLVADSDHDGLGTLDVTSADLSCNGGRAEENDGFEGDGGGGRIALSGAQIDEGGTTTVAGGNHGRPECAGGAGSVAIDAKGGKLVLKGAGGGLAANVYSNYTFLSVLSAATLELGGVGTIVSVTISNPATASIAGTLVMDVDGTDGGSADKLTVTNDLDITNATLTLNTMGAWDDDVYVLAEYDSLAGLAGEFAVTNGMSGEYFLDYDYEGNKIALVLAPDVDVTPLTLTYGDVIVNDTSNLTVQVYNAGGKVLTITGVSTSLTDAANFEVTEWPAAVAVGGTSNIVVAFTPDVVKDGYIATLTISTDDPDEPTVDVTLGGNGVISGPAISVPTTLAFGQTVVDTTKPLTLDITNDGGDDLIISGITPSGTDAAQFTVVESFPLTVIPGTTSNVVVEYNPPTTPAHHDAILTVASNDTNPPEDASIDVTLSGDGVVTLDLIATSGTLEIDTIDAEITYDADGPGGNDPVVLPAEDTAQYTARWTFGDFKIGSGVTLTLRQTLDDASRAIRITADGQGLTATGNIDIEKTLTLNGDAGGGVNGYGGYRRFGAGKGGNERDSNRDGQSGIDYGRNANGVDGSGENADWAGQPRGGGGGGFGGAGGRGNSSLVSGGRAIGRQDLADLGTAGSPRAGSGGGAGPRGAGGAGGGAIQLLAVNDITLAAGVSISANGGEGNTGNGSTTDENRQGGGGGSGGGIRLVADSDRNGTGTLTYTDALLAARGARANGNGGQVNNSYAGDGGGGRIVVSGAFVFSGTADASGGDHGDGNGRPGEDGSILIDTKDGVLSLTGNGRAANAYSSYTSLVVSADSTLELGGAGVVTNLDVANNVATEVVIAGTLAIDMDGNTVSADRLNVVNTLDISAATLDITAINAPYGLSDYIIAQYGALKNAAPFASVVGLPISHSINYAANGGTQIRLEYISPPTLFLLK